MSSLSNFGSESLKPSELLDPRTFPQDPHSLQKNDIQRPTLGLSGSFPRHEDCMKSAIACNVLAMLTQLTVASHRGSIVEMLKPRYGAPVSVKYYRYDSGPVAASFGHHRKPMMNPGTRCGGSSGISQYYEVNDA